MAISRKKKEEIVRELVEKIKGASSIVFSTYHGLGVNDVSDLREKLTETGAEFKVAKKTLIKIALKNAKKDGVDIDALKGEVGLALGKEDEVAPAKLINQFRKEHEGLEFQGGFLEDKVLTADEVLALAKLPSKEELVAKIVGSIAVPLSGLVNVLNGTQRNLVYALQAIADNKK